MGVLKLKDGQNWIPIKTIKGDSGVYVGDTEPDPSDYNVWIDPEGEDDTPQLINKADVITDSASGSIVSIPDGMASPVLGLDVEIEPIQDLHGYDNPWPAGGGKNLFKPTTVLDSPYTSNGVTITFDVPTGEFVFNGTCTASYNFSLDNWSTNYISWTPESGNFVFTVSASATNAPADQYEFIQSGYFKDGAPLQNSVTFGGSRTFTVACDGTNVIHSRSYVNIIKNVTYNNFRLKIQLELGGTATSFAPYSNLCPISGRSEVTVTRTGKNLIPNKTFQWTANNLLLGDDSNRYGILLKPGTYTFSLNREVASALYCQKEGTTENIALAGSSSAINNTIKGTFTVTEEAKYKFWTYKSGGVTSSDINWFQLELGSTASSYHPYQAQTVTIPLGQTVYGGTLDITSGKLVIDKAIADLTTGMTGGSAGSSYVWYKQLQNASTVPNSQIANIISEAYKPIRYNAIASNVNHIALKDNGVIYVNTGSQSVLPVGNVVYALATPVEVTLTAEELDILFGDNNIWSDASSVSCTYRADTRKWIEKKLAQLMNA